MKPSHFTTPRTLGECYFDPRGQAVFNTTPQSSMMSDRTLLLCFAGLAVALAAILYFF